MKLQITFFRYFTPTCSGLLYLWWLHKKTYHWCICTHVLKSLFFWRRPCMMYRQTMPHNTYNCSSNLAGESKNYLNKLLAWSWQTLQAAIVGCLLIWEKREVMYVYCTQSSQKSCPYAIASRQDYLYSKLSKFSSFHRSNLQRTQAAFQKY